MTSLILFALFSYLYSTVSAFNWDKGRATSDPVIHATNVTSVPSALYIVDAVECLREALNIYTNKRDELQIYRELFHEKHNNVEWDVIYGYKEAYITSRYYVETSVTQGKVTDYYLLFSKDDCTDNTLTA